MHYFLFLFLAFVLVGCSVLLKDEKEIDQVIEDMVHEELTHPL